MLLLNEKLNNLYVPIKCYNKCIQREVVMKRLVLFILAGVIVILMGCQKTVLETTEAKDILQTVDMESYLTSEVGKAGFNGIVFCAYDILFAEQNANKTTIYLWVLCQEYYQEQHILKLGTGRSLPVAVFIGNENGDFRILNCRIPSDMNYAQDIKDIFPRNVQAKFTPRNSREMNNYNERIRDLEKIVENKAQKYFNVEDIDSSK